LFIDVENHIVHLDDLSRVRGFTPQEIRTQLDRIVREAREYDADIDP